MVSQGTNTGSGMHPEFRKNDPKRQQVHTVRQLLLSALTNGQFQKAMIFFPRPGWLSQTERKKVKLQQIQPTCCYRTV
jgi:hypothetical protein